MTGDRVTDEQLAEWERAEGQATDGPWSAADEHGLIEGSEPAWCVSRMRPGYEAMSETGGYLYDIAYTTGTNEQADAEFIAAAREAVPALTAEVRASRAGEAELLAERGDWQAMARIEVLDRLGQLRNQRDELQQRIGNALVWCQKANPRPDLNGDQLADLRAALTGTENTDHG